MCLQWQLTHRSVSGPTPFTQHAKYAQAVGFEPEPSQLCQDICYNTDLYRGHLVTPAARPPLHTSTANSSVSLQADSTGQLSSSGCCHLMVLWGNLSAATATPADSLFVCWLSKTSFQIRGVGFDRGYSRVLSSGAILGKNSFTFTILGDKEASATLALISWLKWKQASSEHVSPHSWETQTAVQENSFSCLLWQKVFT